MGRAGLPAPVDEEHARERRTRLRAVEPKTTTDEADLVSAQRIAMPPARVCASREQKDAELGLARLGYPAIEPSAVRRVAEPSLSVPSRRRSPRQCARLRRWSKGSRWARRGSAR